VVDPVELGSARHDPGGDDHLVVHRQVGEGRLGAEPHVDPQDGQAPGVEAQRLGEVLLARHGHGEAELAPDRR
jgi:hypothetical protein